MIDVLGRKKPIHGKRIASASYGEKHNRGKRE
jgi:hypothetical protein